MKQSWKWEECDLVRLIQDEVQEDLNLEYKSSDAVGRSDKKKAEISKDISSFANAVGGTLVYGIKERDNNYPVAIDDGVDRSEYSKEWLEDVITSAIHPKIDNVRVNEVQLSGRREGRVAFVVHVPPSDTAHMAKDRRYYKRRNFKSEPMEDYEVRDVMNRTSGPKLELRLGFNGSQLDANAVVPVELDEGLMQTKRVEVSAEIVNHSPIVATHAFVVLYFSEGISVLGPTTGHGQDYWSRADNVPGTLKGINMPTQIAYQHNGNSFMPIWNGISMHLSPGIGLVFHLGGHSVWHLGYQMSSPGMKRQALLNTLGINDSRLILLDQHEVTLDRFPGVGYSRLI